ncbi:hypothetical protein BDK61_2541 [Haloarcula quadrata]|uniref:Uncharacterized protein n=1 Tax=Haloarcula quadrata TaxID=182779 RepID=A0A495R7C5_9EURY|nr:hypothetical protein BDK61_2541 [Haloarcula quadrata]
MLTYPGNDTIETAAEALISPYFGISAQVLLSITVSRTILNCFTVSTVVSAFYFTYLRCVRC